MTEEFGVSFECVVWRDLQPAGQPVSWPRKRRASLLDKALQPVAKALGFPNRKELRKASFEVTAFRNPERMFRTEKVPDIAYFAVLQKDCKFVAWFDSYPFEDVAYRVFDSEKDALSWYEELLAENGLTRRNAERYVPAELIGPALNPWEVAGDFVLVQDEVIDGGKVVDYELHQNLSALGEGMIEFMALVDIATQPSSTKRVPYVTKFEAGELFGEDDELETFLPQDERARYSRRKLDEFRAQIDASL